MSNELTDLVVILNRDGYDASINCKYRTVDITRIKGRPLLDPWPLLLDPASLRQVLGRIRNHLGPGSSMKDAIEDLAYRIESDVNSYDPSEGPFALDDHGNAIRKGLDD